MIGTASSIYLLSSEASAAQVVRLAAVLEVLLRIDAEFLKVPRDVSVRHGGVLRVTYPAHNRT